jgi:hypothetical protein
MAIMCTAGYLTVEIEALSLVAMLEEADSFLIALSVGQLRKCVNFN